MGQKSLLSVLISFLRKIIFGLIDIENVMGEHKKIGKNLVTVVLSLNVPFGLDNVHSDIWNNVIICCVW